MTGFRDSIEHPDLRTLYDYWNERRRGRRWPARADINPLELKAVLGNLSLIDVAPTSPPRLTFRLMGTLFSQRIGQDLTGKTVDDIPDPAYRAEVTANYCKIVETGEPSVSLAERMFDNEARRFETIRLPLSEDGKAINMVLICALYFEPPPATPALGPRGDSTFKAPKTIKKD